MAGMRPSRKMNEGGPAVGTAPVSPSVSSELLQQLSDFDVGARHTDVAQHPIIKFAQLAVDGRTSHIHSNTFEQAERCKKGAAGGGGVHFCLLMEKDVPMAPLLAGAGIIQAEQSVHLPFRNGDEQ